MMQPQQSRKCCALPSPAAKYERHHIRASHTKNTKLSHHFLEANVTRFAPQSSPAVLNDPVVHLELDIMTISDEQHTVIQRLPTLLDRQHTSAVHLKRRLVCLDGNRNRLLVNRHFQILFTSRCQVAVVANGSLQINSKALCVSQEKNSLNRQI